MRRELTPVEFRLLLVLAKHRTQVFSRARLLDAIYLDDHVVNDRTVESHIKNLRRKLRLAWPQSDPIEAIYRVGYKFNFPRSANHGGSISYRRRPRARNRRSLRSQ